MTDDPTDPMIRELLSLVASQEDGGWWGHDTNCGTDAEIMEQARSIVRRHLCGTTMAAVQYGLVDTLKVFDVSR